MKRFDIKPFVPKSRLMAVAWKDCLLWAVGNPEILEAFRRDTGVTWKPGRTGIERAIDQTCGMDAEFCRAFIPWFQEHVWGKTKAAG